MSDFDLTFPEGVLRPFCRLTSEESDYVFRMRSHPAVSKWMTSGGDISLEAHSKYIARQKDDLTNRNYLMFSNDVIVGVVSLHRIDRRNQLAFLGLYRNPFSKESGIGRRLLGAICRLSFQQFGLHSLKLEVVADNRAAIQLYEAFGFLQEGRWRECVRRDGEFVDLIAMGLLRSEWLNGQIEAR
ncbi:UDP-4-amino-4,6-dideoxy-N-acetyl-beta-L-altrosamine N-acetyltransferase [Sinorhizobium fredii]|uniref:UDP-4-amino-4, 6-dideoxy-N-acetyl-beta-L-altrosamine N-acetyltransferase n=1 Tax=Rhizobium fredii TaxID=380 RepID=UPI0006936654|nr:UDP-4-amino-4,6-dideoxy-N-acetyl-beta-L-altrosamine N-acetyltransferase [Sinorhizobium fredii]WOS64781.1 UDP-4-amino-4,6-dideoxy-N-acetyl-beta-L-altrosamine N-acetyltransferase [Sinorhizobium fredii GR64]